MKLPESLTNSLVNVEGFDKQAFEKLHTSGEQVTSIRINPLKLTAEQSALTNLIHNSQFKIDNKVPWSDFGYYLKQRPSFTFDPLFHAGCYYVQEASSMFLEQALKQTVDLSKPLKILDLAAAPGGKSTHVQSLISSDSLLVSNEVIRSRANVLQSNIIKWGADNVVVTNNDPKEFARLKDYFDVIIVDAPCSGSGLFRRDEEAINEWSLNNVQLCTQRQQRIIANVWPALKKDGVLIYSTCSYSTEEDEKVIDWMNAEFRTENVDLTIPDEWNIVKSSVGYRFWPYLLKGEGFFIGCMRKLDGQNETEFKVKKKVESVSRKEMEILKHWVKDCLETSIKISNIVYAVPHGLLNEINMLTNHVRVIYFGTMIGELVREKLVPAHALAQSDLVSDRIEKVGLDYSQAIQYLQKKNLPGIDSSVGWKLVTYKSFPLGWINVLPARINNYYPKDLRILKDI